MDGKSWREEIFFSFFKILILKESLTGQNYIYLHFRILDRFYFIVKRVEKKRMVRWVSFFKLISLNVKLLYWLPSFELMTWLIVERRQRNVRLKSILSNNVIFFFSELIDLLLICLYILLLSLIFFPLFLIFLIRIWFIIRPIYPLMEYWISKKSFFKKKKGIRFEI